MKVVCPNCGEKYDMSREYCTHAFDCENCGMHFHVGCETRTADYAGAAAMFRVAVIFLVLAGGWHQQYMYRWMWHLCWVFIALSAVYTVAYLKRWVATRASTAVLPRFRIMVIIDIISVIAAIAVLPTVFKHAFA